MKNIDQDLKHTVNDVGEINEILQDTNVMLVDQTGKLNVMDKNNKDITSEQKHTDRVLNRIKWK